MKHVTFADLVTIYEIDGHEERSSSWVSDGIRFRARIQAAEAIIGGVLLKKLNKFNEQRASDMAPSSGKNKRDSD